MTFGWNQASAKVDAGVAAQMVRRAAAYAAEAKAPRCHIDTARIYAGGQTEHILGQALREVPEVKGMLRIGTKAHPSEEGGLSPAGIRRQLKASLAAMGVDRVDELYLHQPDPERPLLDSLRCMDELVKAGVVGEVGMSNYSHLEMQRAFDLCAEHGLTEPTVYQGLYNPLNRSVEKDLLPVLRRNGCAFVAYNPLAGGLLSGKHARPAAGAAVPAGRFKDNPNYLPRFYTDACFDSLDRITRAADEVKVGVLEASYSWLLCHSALETTDGVLLGASSLAQLDQNLNACAAAADTIPTHCGRRSINPKRDFAVADGAADAFPYWRSYSSDMPGRDALDQGAAYSVQK